MVVMPATLRRKLNDELAKL
jgi:hypothetical protein